MNFYSFHIGDYATHTAHLDLLEDLAYRRMIDLYYLRGAPLPKDVNEVSRLIRMRSNQDCVEAVLGEFFTLTDEGWSNSRCNADLAKMQDKQAKAKASAAASVTSRSTNAKRTLNERLTNAQLEVNIGSTDVELPIPIPIPIDTPIPPVGESPSPIPEKQKSAVSLKTWLESIKSTGEKPISETDPVFEYAEKVGIPQEYLRLCWREFRERYGQDGAKRYKDWRSVFRKAVRGNWFKLWWVDSCGTYALTTTGKQAEMAAA